MDDKELGYDQKRNATSAAHTAKVAADKEKERLRGQAKRDKKKAEAAAATAALLQLNVPLLLPALVVAPPPIPPPAPLAFSLQLPPIANRPSGVEAPPPKRRKRWLAS